jgi:hypothetical protein
MFDPSPARKGLNDLLAFFPHFDLLEVEWQVEEEIPQQTEWGGIAIPRYGPWVLVKMGQPSDGISPAWAVWEFAIWRNTGAVYTMSHGAVSDDPIFPVRV